MRNKIRNLALLLIPTLGMISLVIICACHSRLLDGYQMIWLMPIVYTAFILCFSKQIFYTDYTLTVMLYFAAVLAKVLVIPI